jgi:hypothetical protein
MWWCLCCSAMSGRQSNMAGVNVKLPGVAGVIEARQQLMAQAVADQFANFSPMTVPVPNSEKLRRPMAGDLGKRLTPIGLA